MPLPMDEAVFENLEDIDAYGGLRWLRGLHQGIDHIVSFGCMKNSTEPIALIWHLGASKITVVEKEARNLESIKEKIEDLRQTKRTAALMSEREINFIVADMTSSQIPELEENHYDLAFCERVLYFIPDSEEIRAYYEDPNTDRLQAYRDAFRNEVKNNPAALQKAIEQMNRSLRYGGYLVAVEPYFSKEQDTDIHHLFINVGLVPVSIPDCPGVCYSFRKMLV